MTTTSGSAKWQGGIKDGKGAISTKSGALKDYPYGFASRFEGKPGSNPEELRDMINRGAGTLNMPPSNPNAPKGNPSGMAARNPNIKYT